jgi:hypothetical protein
MRSKLYGGGGDGVAHSRPDAPHGSAGAGAPARRLRHTLTKNTSTLSATVNAPIVDSRLSPDQPASAGYV